MNNETYTYDQVCAILCEACRLKVPSAAIPDETMYDSDQQDFIYHMVNGNKIACRATAWRRLASKLPPFP